MSEALLDRESLMHAFTRLAHHLARQRTVGEVHVFGGAAMVLAFDSRVSTRDVDALFRPDTHVLDAAARVADELGLPRSWLNNQAASYVSGQAGRGAPVFDHPFLRVLVTPPEHLLAMKVRAARSTRDAEDILVLLEHLQLTQWTEIEELVGRYFPDPLKSRSRDLIEDLLEKRRAT